MVNKKIFIFSKNAAMGDAQPSLNLEKSKAQPEKDCALVV